MAVIKSMLIRLFRASASKWFVICTLPFLFFFAFIGLEHKIGQSVHVPVLPHDHNGSLERAAQLSYRQTERNPVSAANLVLIREAPSRLHREGRVYTGLLMADLHQIYISATTTLYQDPTQGVSFIVKPLILNGGRTSYVGLCTEQPLSGKKKEEREPLCSLGIPLSPLYQIFPYHSPKQPHKQ